MRPEMSITNQFHDTIVAPSTPPGSSGLAVIRLSGERAIEIVDALFQPIRPVTTLFEMAGYQTVFGDLAGLDEVMVALLGRLTPLPARMSWKYPAMVDLL